MRSLLHSECSLFDARTPSVTLSTERTVLAYYSISSSSLDPGNAAGFVVCHMTINNVEQVNTRSIFGNLGASCPCQAYADLT